MGKTGGGFARVEGVYVFCGEGKSLFHIGPCQIPNPSAEKVASLINAAHAENVKGLVEALEKLRDCDWTISLPDRMDAVRKIAREALEKFQ